MLPLFSFYNNSLQFSRLMTRSKFGHEGAFWQEAGPVFGASFQSTNCTSSWCAGPRHNEISGGGSYGTYNFQQSLDLGLLLLDHHAYFQQRSTFTAYFPLVAAGLDWFTLHYNHTDEDGRIEIYPSQALETWWCITFPAEKGDCVTNDMPSVAGFSAVLNRVLALPAPLLQSIASPEQLGRWSAALPKLPPLPMLDCGNSSNQQTMCCSKANDSLILCPGKIVWPPTHNSENVELYAVHPYREITSTMANATLLDAARQTYRYRRHPCNSGWCQDVMDAALLGLTAEAKAQVVQRALSGAREEYSLRSPDTTRTTLLASTT